MSEHIGPMVHVRGRIENILPDDQLGLKHQCIVLGDVDVLRIAGGEEREVEPKVFCAIRYGEDVGKARIHDFRIGDPIEVQGEYLADSYESLSNRDGLPVIHCAHKPFGFVKIGEHHYH